MKIRCELTQDVVRLDVRVNNVRLLHELEAQKQLLRVGSEIYNSSTNPAKSSPTMSRAGLRIRIRNSEWIRIIFGK
jgi:hypothetical protein